MTDPWAANPCATDPWAEWQRTRQRRTLELPGHRRAAVLVGLSLERDPRLLLTLRSDELPTHKGQISFPGGSLKGGETPAQAAVREAWEEVGLSPERIQVLGELDDVWTPAGFHVTPVQARLDAAVKLRLSQEVSAILLPRLSELRLAEQLPPEQPRTGPDGQTALTYRYVWQGHEIWGMTARVLWGVLASGVS
ncbi:CoA pyrophosphatase [Deinococcus sp.]|uniref:NUDIX hydrolase n=1 Tax=Deinococcus sp. TaxID=47478 RepID=UPI0025F825FE|nr:CoA pyrophosphatase [Deinococcus sp.]